MRYIRMPIERPHLAATLGPQVITVSSLSKAYGIPGIRLGWIVSSDRALQELFLAAKEQISVCGSVIHEWIGESILARSAGILSATLTEMRQRLALVTRWMESESLLEWVPPDGGVVCLPRMRTAPAGGAARFYRHLQQVDGGNGLIPPSIHVENERLQHLNGYCRTKLDRIGLPLERRSAAQRKRDNSPRARTRRGRSG